MNEILTSIITISSIIISVGFPFIIYLVSNHKSKNDRLLLEMKSKYPVVKIFQKLIYDLFQIDFWKNKTIVRNYEIAVRKGNNEEVDNLTVENDFLILYKSFKFISDNYRKEILENINKIYTYNEIVKYKTHINTIWYSIDCRTDIRREIDDLSFSKLADNELNRILKTINKISLDDKIDQISISEIALIAGETEINVIDPLVDLTWYYELPINSIVKKLYGIMSVSLIFGIIGPILLMLISTTYNYYLTLLIIAVLFSCFFTLIFITGKYIGK